MKLNAIIVDSDNVASKQLVQLLENYKEVVNHIGSADSAIKGSQMIRELRPQLVFTEALMLGGSAFEMLDLFNNIDFELIFTANEEQFAVKAFKYGATDYLMKPVDEKELGSAIYKARRNFNTKNGLAYNAKVQQYISIWNDKIAVPTKKGYKLISLEDIVRLEAEGSYVTVHTKCDKPQLVSKPLKHYAMELNRDIFIRVHRSHLVNIRYISEYCKNDGGYLIMENGDKVEVAAQKKTALLSHLLE